MNRERNALIDRLLYARAITPDEAALLREDGRSHADARSSVDALGSDRLQSGFQSHAAPSDWLAWPRSLWEHAGEASDCRPDQVRPGPLPESMLTPLQMPWNTTATAPTGANPHGEPPAPAAGQFFGDWFGLCTAYGFDVANDRIGTDRWNGTTWEPSA